MSLELRMEWLYTDYSGMLCKEKRIIMIKPKQIRFWMKSIALRDADDTFNDILNTWYNE